MIARTTLSARDTTRVRTARAAVSVATSARGARTARMADRAIEELVDAAVFLLAARVAHEVVSLHRVHGELPIGLSELDEALRESHDILEVYVVVDHAMQHEQRVLEPLRKINGRRLPVRYAVLLRRVQNLGGVAV